MHCGQLQKCFSWNFASDTQLLPCRNHDARITGSVETAAVETNGIGKQYARRWALRDCTLSIPAARVVGLVGPNGAGKTTFLQLTVGLSRPTTGTIAVLGSRPAEGPAQLARVGFVAQDTPTYAGLTVAEHLRLGAWLNPHWDADLANRRIGELGLDPKQKAKGLSGGQRAQLALTLAIAKRPELLMLDEPVASLDPLARHEFMQYLSQAVAEQELSVVLSSHLVGDLEDVCNYLVVLAASRVQVTGEVEGLLTSHYRLFGARRGAASLPKDVEVIATTVTDQQSSLLVRSERRITDPTWTVEAVDLESLVIAYMSRARNEARDQRLAPGAPS